jgi:hypothetical protein
MNNKTPIFIAATIGLSILTVSISVNFASARNTIESEYFGGMGYGHGDDGGMDHAGTRPVWQESVDTGNHHEGMDYGRHGGYETMAHGGTGPVIQEPVNTGNHDLDKAINKFYDCLSHTHEDPPTVQNTDTCYYQTVGSNRDTQT